MRGFRGKSCAFHADTHRVSTIQLQSEVETDYQPEPIGLAAMERRRSARQSRQLSGWLSDAADSGRMRQQQQITVTNLSMGGLGFHAPKLLHRGDSHWIVIADSALHLSTRVRVVSVRCRDDGSCDVGAEFF